MIDQFTEWLEKIHPELEKTGLILATRLDSEPEALIDDILEIEAQNARIGELRAIADSWLDRGKLYFLPSKEEGLSEGERRAVVDDKVRDIRRVRDILESYQDAIKHRITLGQSILAYERQFIERNQRSSADFLKPIKSLRDVLGKPE